MTIFAIADFHLSFGTPNKKMDVFGENWTNHHETLRKNWLAVVKEDDLVLIAGDTSWALHLENALPDLEWIDALPGTKVLIKGNHDLWWKSKAKIEALLPSSLHIIHNDAFEWRGVAIGGTRLWETPEISYSPYINFRVVAGVHMHVKPDTEEEKKHDEKIFATELDRLKLSLAAMNKSARKRIVMLHYPPAGPEHKSTPITRLLQEANIDICLYGHLHNLKPDAPVNFTIDGVQCLCTSCDYLHFHPLKILLT